MHEPRPDDPSRCPVCGYSPCTDTCLFGLQAWDLDELREMFEQDGPAADDDEPPAVYHPKHLDGFDAESN